MEDPAAEQAPESKELSFTPILVFLPLALILLQVFQAYSEALGSFLPTCHVLAWVLPAYLYAQSQGRDPFREFALLTRPQKAGWLEAALLSFLGLPLYAFVIGNWVLEPQEDPADWARWGSFFIHQLCFVALAEEFYFRGALQGALEKKFSAIQACLIASLLFALAHVLADQHFLRLLVFFPGLLFGWLKIRSGSIIPGILFHALSNLTYFFFPLHQVL